jgi:acetyl esterase/lipase
MLREFSIPREGKDSVTAWLYWNGTEEELANCEKLVLSFTGGGGVSMTPRCHDEYLIPWSKRLNVPILSIQYKYSPHYQILTSRKAPEHPYPYALNECFDVYKILSQNPQLILPFRPRKIVFVGDSAGGNFATSVLLMLLHENLLRPIGLILIYPNLDYNIHSWMTDEQMELFKSASMKEIPSAVLDTKQNYERRKSVLQLIPDSKPTSFLTPKPIPRKLEQPTEKKRRNAIATRLAMTSRVAFSQDRIITTELMRAMAILYIGPKNKPNFETDYLLSPLRAPVDLLALFPKTYLMCGEKDPLVDDTIVMAGRIREAKRAVRNRRRGITMSTREDMDLDWVEMMLIRGVSHGFLQMTSFLPEGRVAVDKVGTWLEELFTEGDFQQGNGTTGSKVIFSIDSGESDSESEERPLEIGSSRQLSPQPSPSPGKASPGKISPSKEVDHKRNHYRHDTWESKNVLKEQQLMERRREALTRGLEAPSAEAETSEGGVPDL